MQHSTATLRRACAIGATIAVIGLSAGFGALTATTAFADEQPVAPTSTATASPAQGADSTADGADESAPPVPGATSRPTAEATADPTAEPSLPVSTPAATATPDPTAPVAAEPAASPTATITGDATVGSTLTATGHDFTGDLAYAWTSGDTSLPVTADSYVVAASDAGKTISVTITSDAEESATTTTAVITQEAAFPEASTEDDPITFSAVAGERFAHTFAAEGFPAPTYSAAYYSLDDPYASEDDGDESGYLPYGLSLDHATGALSGKPRYSGTYAFRIVATSGTTTASQYVNITIDAAAPLGVEVTAEDKDTFLTAHSTSWVIERDGTVWTFENETTRQPDGGYIGFGVGFEGGQPTIDQGGTLLVSGHLVDRFGNEVDDADGYPVPFTVTSDHASDVITPSRDPWVATDVTFPEASTHSLEVASSGFATAFTVDVQPTAAPAVSPTGTVVTPTASTGELAYTGSDAMHLLPWAGGLAVTGAAVIALQASRRRKQH
ncbi:hypothetical protein [Curtobacterium citreum]|uniref:Gram-positive cocci surface proteins LPxTG domain-containing protein n=1 Tax=Curtobacterium citreum TaxID=2036 RepID=A0ABU8YA95_9MICO